MIKKRAGIISLIFTGLMFIQPVLALADEIPQEGEIIIDEVVTEENESEESVSEDSVEEEYQEFDSTLEVTAGALIVDNLADLLFHMTFNESPGSEIILYDEDNNELGKLMDNGLDGDIASGDLTYTCAVQVTPTEVGSRRYIAKFGGYESNIVELPVLKQPGTAEYDEYNQIEKIITDIENKYKGDYGYVMPSLYETMYEDVYQTMLSLQEQGYIIYIEYGEGQYVNIQTSGGLWMLFQTTAPPENTEPEDTDLAKARWTRKDDLNNTNKTQKLVLTSDTQRYEIFYYTGGNEANSEKIPRPHITLVSNKGEVYDISSGGTVGECTARNYNEVDNYDGVYYDVLYISGDDIAGEWNMDIAIPQNAVMFALLPTKVPDNWQTLVSEYKTEPLSDPILWMDDSENEDFIRKFPYIFAKAPKEPEVNNIQDVPEDTTKDYSGLITLITILGVIVVIVISVLISLKKKRRKRAERERRQESIANANEKVRNKRRKMDDDLEAVLALDDYSDDDFYADSGLENPAAGSVIENVIANEQNISVQNNDIPSEQPVPAPEPVSEPTTQPVETMANSVQQNTIPVTNDVPVPDPQSDIAPAPETGATISTGGFSLNQQPFTDAPDADYSDEAYENAMAEVKNKLINEQLQAKAHKEAEALAAKRAAEEAARQKAIAEAMPKDRPAMQNFNADMPAWMRQDAPAATAVNPSAGKKNVSTSGSFF